MHAESEEAANLQWQEQAISVDDPRQAHIDRKACSVDEIDVMLVVDAEPLALAVIMMRRKRAARLGLVLEAHGIGALNIFDAWSGMIGQRSVDSGV
jgi:hypothetical protein